MEIIIKSVGIGAKHEGFIPYFHILAKLRSGKEITLFDDKYDLRNYINQKIECLVSVNSVDLVDLEQNPEVNDSYPTILKGFYIDKYKIPEKWKKYKNDISCAIQNEDGIILLDEYSLREYNLKDKDIIAIDVSRFDLLEWIPIK